MNKRIIFLLVFTISVAFSSSLQAVELYETGNVNIHGFISQGYMISDGNNFFADTKGDGTFQYSEAAVNFTTDVSDRLSLGIQLFARDLGKMGNNKLTIDWAFADYSFTDWLNLKAGKIKLPYGLYNTERDVDMLRTFVFLPQSIYYEGWRDSSNALNGAGFYGYIDAGIAGAFSYEAYLGNSIVETDGGVARLLTDKMPASMDLDLNEINVEYTNTATLVWESIFGLEGLRISGSVWAIEFAAESEYNNGGYVTGYSYDATGNVTALTDLTGVVYTRSESTFNVRTVTGAISLEYIYNNFVFAAEVMQNDYMFELENPVDGGDPLIDSEFKTLGWYSSMTYRFTDWLELGTYYSEYYSDDDDKDGKDFEEAGSGDAHQQYIKDICLTARFDISANWILKIEGHQMKGAALLYRTDDNQDEDGNADYTKDWCLGAVKLTYSF